MAGRKCKQNKAKSAATKNAQIPGSNESSIQQERAYRPEPSRQPNAGASMGVRSLASVLPHESSIVQQKGPIALSKGPIALLNKSVAPPKGAPNSQSNVASDHTKERNDSASSSNSDATTSIGSSASTSATSVTAPSKQEPDLRYVAHFVEDTTVRGAASRLAFLSPYYHDGFSHGAGVLADLLGKKDDKDAIIKRKNDRNVQSTAATYWYVRCSWEGESDVVDVIGGATQRTMSKRLDEAEEYYATDNATWAIVEKGADIIWELVKRRFLGTQPNSKPLKRKLLDTRGDKLVFVTEREPWKDWGVRKEGAKGANKYGEALMKAREELKKPQWQDWLKAKTSIW